MCHCRRALAYRHHASPQTFTGTIPFSNDGCVGHNDRQAPATTTLRFHEPFANIDATLLGSEPLLALGGFRGIQNFAWPVSPLFFGRSSGFPVSVDPPHY